MSALSQTDPVHRNRRTIPAIAVWLALSAVLHIVLLLWAPRPRPQHGAEPEMPPLTVVLRPQTPPEQAPAPAPAPPVAVAPPPPPKARTPRQPPPQAAKAPPPVVALTKPKPEEPPTTVPPPKPEETPAPPAPAAPATPTPAEPDLAAYIEAKRRARGEAPDASVTDAERANRGPLNSALLKQPVPTNFTPQKPRNGYGSFEIRRRGFDYAEYMFKGWNENFRRNGLELIEVRQGNSASIDLAVIRSIISVIRRTETGDFTWISQRLGRSITLSARPRDNSGLEEFMLQEFYEDLHRYR